MNSATPAPIASVIKTIRTPSGFYADLSCGKVKASIGLNEFGLRVVQTSNASHRAWGGFGRSYESVDAAKAHFKSSAMQAMLSLFDSARNLNT